jgi:outer membrane lipoprotein-sorting protein
MKTWFQFFCALFCLLLFFGLSFAGFEDPPCDSAESIKKTILGKIAEVRSYRLEASVNIDDTVVFTKILGITPDRLRIEQSFKSGKDQVHITEVFDRKVQWIETRKSDKIQVLKINTDELVENDRPFDTGYYLMGTGLINGEDFPSTIKILLSVYALSAKCHRSKIVLTGYLDQANFDKYVSRRKFKKANKPFTEEYKKRFRFAEIVVGYPDYGIQKYSLGPSNKTVTLTTHFNDIQTNLDGIEEAFHYKAPNGVQPHDITDEIKRALADG